MGGLTIGASYADGGQGAAENDDISTMGAKYSFSSGAVKGQFIMVQVPLMLVL